MTMFPRRSILVKVTLLIAGFNSWIGRSNNGGLTNAMTKFPSKRNFTGGHRKKSPFRPTLVSSTAVTKIDASEMASLPLQQEEEAKNSGEDKKTNPIVQIGCYIRDSLIRFKDGTVEMYTNYQKCNAIRQKQKQFQIQHPDQKKKRGITYTEYNFLESQKLDRNKLGNILFLMFFAPNAMPYAIMFFPNMLPSPFTARPPPDLSSFVDQWVASSRDRAHAVLRTFLDIEKQSGVDTLYSPRSGGFSLNPFGGKNKAKKQQQLMECVKNDAISLLSSKNIKNNILENDLFSKEIYTQEEPDKSRTRLIIVPKPILKNLERLIDALDSPSSSSINFLPFYFTRTKVWQYIAKITQTDEFLVNEEINLNTLHDYELFELCNQRCIGMPTSTSAELAFKLQQWLDRTTLPTTTMDKNKDGVYSTSSESPLYYNGNLARVVLMCHSAVESARDAACSSTLPRLLFLGPTN